MLAFWNSEDPNYNSTREDNGNGEEMSAYLDCLDIALEPESFLLIQSVKVKAEEVLKFFDKPTTREK